MSLTSENSPVSTFRFPSQVEFGIGSIKNLAKWVQSYNAKTPLIVTDPGIITAGLLTEVQEVLDEAAVPYEVFDKVQPNPIDQSVDEGAMFYRKGTHDLIIALGGGSPMDVAKGIQVVATAGGTINQYFIGADTPPVIPNVKLIAIPTTAGTGSEVSHGAVIIESRTNRKRLVLSGYPTLALIDPMLMKSMPPSLTAATGMDALCHCVEAYVSSRYCPMGEGIALEGIRLIAENLRAAVKDGNDMEARKNMAMASTLAGLAFSTGFPEQKILGVIHSLAHQLSTQLGLSHGVANSLILPWGMNFNLNVAKSKFMRIGFMLGVDISSGSQEEIATSAINAVCKLSQDIGMPQKLSEVGLKREDIGLMAKNAMLDGLHGNNPHHVQKMI
jgi:alcohol dehydrogenase class IV